MIHQLIANRNWLRTSAAAAVCTAGLLGASALPAVASGTTTFAQFTQVDDGNPFTFTNNGSSSVFTSDPVEVNFFYKVANGYEPGVARPSSDDVDAYMTITANATSAASTSGSQISQSLSSITVTFTAVDALYGKSNLLTVTNAAGSLSGTSGGESASLSASTPSSSVTFSSDFLDFSNTTARNLAMSLTSVTPDFAIGVNGWLASFAAAATGTFASNPVPTAVTVNPPAAVPEPGMMVFAAVNGFGVGGIMLRSRLQARRKSAFAL